jgi:hypothetical protein
MVPYLMSLLLLVSAYPGIHQLDWEAHRNQPPAVKGDGTKPAWEPLVKNPAPALTRTVYGYSPYWTTDTYLHFNLMTQLACFSVGLNADGSLNNSAGFPGTWAWDIAHAHRNGVKVELVATCFSSSTIHSAITTGAANAITNLVTMAAGAGIEGVNIDFEGVLGSDKANLTAFIQRLSAACRSRGMEVSMATPAVDWSNAFDYSALADTAGGLFIMGYDYYWSGSSVAGPVSPLTGWGTYNVRWTINDYITYSGGQRDKLILGLPYYGYEWPTTSGNAHSSTTGTGTAVIYTTAKPNAQAYGELWDSESQTPWYAFNSGGWRQGWYDDDASLLIKYGDVNGQDLQGTGMWALAYDGARREMWAALREGFNPPQANFLNGSCETWIVDTTAVPSDTSHIPTGWLPGRRARVTQASDYVHGGSYALRHSPDSIGDAWPQESVLFQDVSVTPGMTYAFSGWARKNDGAGNRMKLNLQWFNASHAVLSEANSPVLTQDSTAYLLLSTGPVTAPGNAVFARLRLYLWGYGYWDRWDDVSFTTVGVEEEKRGFEGSRVQGFKVNPNPFVSYASVPGYGRERFALYDISGRLVGMYQGDKIGADVSPGVYFIRRAGADVAPVRIVKLR